MPSLNEKLAQSLTELKNLSNGGKRRIFQSDQLSRTHRERLLEAGFLKEIIKGWVLMTRPDERSGDSTSWYSSFWEFCRAYCDERFKSDWVLSAENSIPLLAENLNVPKQVVVAAPTANNQTQPLLHGTSLYLYKVQKLPVTPVETAGVHTFPAPEAICSAAPAFWHTQKSDVIALLGSLRNVSSISKILLEGGHAAVAGRIAGAYRLLGNARAANDIITAMTSAGHDVREDTDPFKAPVPMQISTRATPPIMTRVRLMWAEMRAKVLENFKIEPRRINDHEGYLAAIDERYTSDAYHSLSIEGYSVTEDLIEKVRTGNWDPDGSDGDRKQKDAMAAKGYWDAFQLVRAAVARVLDGEDAAEIADQEHLDWYRALFQPSIQAGIIKPENLAGYRTHFVFIRNSGHTPVAWESVPDAMDAFLDCLKNEEDPRVRAVLGHFIFTFIHPLPDGNGRTGRFLMNVMMASGGLPWTILPVDRRDEYMAALERASVHGDIGPFAAFLADCCRHEPPPPRRSRPGEVQALADLNETGDPIAP